MSSSKYPRAIRVFQTSWKKNVRQSERNRFSTAGLALHGVLNKNFFSLQLDVLNKNKLCGPFDNEKKNRRFKIDNSYNS